MSKIARPATIIAATVMLSACGITTGKKDVAFDAPVAEPRAYRLTDADISVPPLSQFLNKSPSMLEESFGSPALVRREGDAEVRQYAAEAPFGRCILLAVLYEDRGHGWRTNHLTVRENGAEAADPAHCLREIAFAAR